MKKILTLSVLLLAVVMMYAQQMRPEASLQPTSEMILSDGTAEYFPLNKAFGDIIWSEDFGGGALPTGWTVYDGNLMDYFWYWSDDARPGYQGTYSTNNDTFYSETADNGYMMISGDIYNAGGGSVAMDSYVMTGAMNFDTVTSAMIEWVQYFRYCCSATTIQMKFSVSTDGVNWTDFDVRQGVAVNAASPNPQAVQINITPLVAGQSTVYMKWHKGGASHYFWAIDDIRIIEAPSNELVLKDTYISNVGLGLSHSGFYSLIPYSQLMPIYFGADVHNNGNAAQTDVNVNTRVYNEAEVLVYDETADTTGVVLAYDSLIAFDMATLFTVPAIDRYGVEFEAIQTEVDEIPENNLSAKSYFSVTENKIFGRDIARTGYASPSQYTGGVDGDFIGVNYFITNNDVVNSISVYVDYRTVPGTQMRAVLFSDATEPLAQIYSEEYVVQKVDLGTWVRLPLIPIAPTDVDLVAGTNYIAGIEFYFQGIGNLWIGGDNSLVHLFNLSSVLRIGSNWYWFSNLPLVRLNLDAATLPPTFTSARLDTCPVNWVYTYNVSLVDPNGLPLTITMDDYYNGTLATITDHGDGTATITSTSSLENLGFAAGGSFRLRIFADNGISRNEQYFYVSVKEFAVIGVDENDLNDIRIYPNPANNLVNIDNAANSSVSIYNLLGEVVKSVRTTSNNTSIDVSNLAAGSYVVKVQGENSNYSHQLNITR
jgi:hypothetical protein